MADKITYLLGAGASANALPLIKFKEDVDLTDSLFSKVKDKKILGGLPTELKNFANEYLSEITQEVKRSLNVKALIDIANECIDFGTPDLYAKYLLETGDEDNYLQLKILLSNYFHLKQYSDGVGGAFKHGSFDKRALSFLTTISNQKKLSEKVKIISWNYDTQIEIAANELRLKNAAPTEFISGFASWPNIPHPGYEGSYSLIHLNGIAGYNYNINDLAERITNPFKFDFEKEPLLSFAWENDDNVEKRTFTQNRLKIATDLAEGTDILVVIGYTFPFFNREIDNIIISKMKPTLEKIYFQDPFLDGQFLYDQFDLLKEDTEVDTGNVLVNKPVIEKKFPIIHISNVDQYYVPYEL